MVNGCMNGGKQVFLELLSSYVQNSPFMEYSLSVEEWQEVISLAKSHNVLPLILERASENDSFAKVSAFQELTFETMAAVAGQVRRTETFLALYRQFIKENLHPVVMKGIICRQLYGEYCDHRPSGDEDILVQKSEYKKFENILINNDFISEMGQVNVKQLDELQEVTFYNAQAGLTVEVHVNLMVVLYHKS